MRFRYSDEMRICIEAVHDLNIVYIEDGYVHLDGTILSPHTSMTQYEISRLFVCLNVQLLELRNNGRYYYMLYPHDIIRLTGDIFIIINHTNFTTDTIGNDMIIHKPYDTECNFIPKELSRGFNAPTCVHKDICNYSVGAICSIYPIMKNTKLDYSVRLVMSYPYLFLYV